MAITINTQPPLFTTLNASIWKITSDRPTILAFKVEVLDVGTGDTIAVQQYATLPMAPLSATFDIAPLLSNTVDYQLRHDPILEESISKTYKSYAVNLTEIYIDVYGNQVEGDISGSDQKYIFNALLSRPEFAYFEYNKYVMLEGNGSSKFLSNRPIVSNIFYSALEYLHFMTNEDGKIRLRFYKRSPKFLMSEKIISISNPTIAHRLNISPAAMDYYFGDDAINLYGLEFTDEFNEVFGTIYRIKDCDYFTVQFLSTADEESSEIKTYVIKQDDCLKKQVQVLFSNNLGGFDSMTFNYPKQTVISDKTSIQTNPLQIDGDGNYYDHRNNVFNPTEAVTSSKQTNTFSLLSDPLSDEMAIFATTLIESDNVYIKLSTGDLFPVPIQSQNYEVKLKKYSTDNNRMSIKFNVYDINFKL